ncbi:MAG: cytochrome c [Alphaproteobacteria bacterium]|nr:cytochrome c [Alphaproteobacteria bacterium]
MEEPQTAPSPVAQPAGEVLRQWSGDHTRFLEQPPIRRLRLSGDKLLARNENLGQLPLSLSGSCPRSASGRTLGVSERAISNTFTVRRRHFAASLPHAVLIALLASTPAAMPMEVDIALAADEFRTYCGVCHGSDGRSGGPAAKALKDRPPDLTKLTRRAGGRFPAEAVFQKIEGLNMPAAHGTSDMPIWGQRFVEQELGDGVLLKDARKAAKATIRRINRLIKYLEAIQE